MKRQTMPLVVPFIYDASHAGAHYSYDNGIHFGNSGEHAEIELKGGLGLEPKKDGNTPYDLGSDIPELNASVKSSKFTLTSVSLADNFDDSIEIYFKNVYSTLWIYVIIIDDVLTAYYMNKEEFKEFLKQFSIFDKNRKVIRGKATSGKTITWLEERVKKE